MEDPRTGDDAGYAVRPGSLRAWGVAMRPRSLLVAVSPVLVGSALACERTGHVSWLAVTLVLVVAVLVQVITNLQNDVGYTVRRADSSGTRTGLPRATANGWLGVGAVRAGIAGCVALAVLLGLALAWYRGWPVLAIGVASVLAALAYMGGPRPIAYTPYGELTVFLFFGWVAVIGTDWVLTGGAGSLTLPAATAIGALAAAALAVNNHRDIAHDRGVGRQTFAVTFGAGASLRLYGALLFLPFALLPAMALLAGHVALMLPSLLLPLAVRVRRAFIACPPGTAFNAVLFQTFRLELWYAALLAAGLVGARLGTAPW